MNDDERFSQDAIDRLTPIEPSAKLRRMVAQIPIEHPRRERNFWPFGNAWVNGLSLAAAALLGLWVGSTQMQRNAGTPFVAETNVSKDAGAPTSATTELSTWNSASEVEASDEELDDLLLLATAAYFEPSDWDLSGEPSEETSEEVY